MAYATFTPGVGWSLPSLQHLSDRDLVAGAPTALVACARSVWYAINTPCPHSVVDVSVASEALYQCAAAHLWRAEDSERLLRVLGADWDRWPVAPCECYICHANRYAWRRRDPSIALTVETARCIKRYFAMTRAGYALRSYDLTARAYRVSKARGPRYWGGYDAPANAPLRYGPR